MQENVHLSTGRGDIKALKGEGRRAKKTLTTRPSSGGGKGKSHQEGNDRKKDSVCIETTFA